MELTMCQLEMDVREKESSCMKYFMLLDSGTNNPVGIEEILLKYYGRTSNKVGLYQVFHFNNYWLYIRYYPSFNKQRV